MRNVVIDGLVSVVIGFGLASGVNAQTVMRSGNVYYRHVCGNVVGLAGRCAADIVTDRAGHLLTSSRSPIDGFTPSDLRSAYNMTATGSAETIIAAVDAYGYTNAESDLAVYRSEFGLPACTTANGCFKKLNQKGRTSNYTQNIGWAEESALDLDMASVACPDCSIYLIEAKTASFRNLGAAVDEAATLGAHVISNSYAGAESKGIEKFRSFYDHPGVAITAPNGGSGYDMCDSGYNDVCAPADMPTVIAVGGTTLARNSHKKRGWSESVWSGTGSGCSAIFEKPKWQTDTGCTMRTIGDTAADADPASGVAVYGPQNNGGSAWLVLGGTSIGAPLVGGVFAANGGRVNAASTLYAHARRLYDITKGSNGTCSPAYLCNGEKGYDGPTGNGTPNGDRAFGDK
ncbi:MAG: S53 family peptidase [Rhizomicrobium sp.]